MKLACQVAAFGFLLYAVAAAPVMHAANAGTPAAAGAQQPAPRSFQEVERRAAAQEGLSGQDKTFLMTAAQGEMLQRELSRVAKTRAKNPAVRRFAAQTEQFISRAEERLTRVAGEFGMSLPQTVPDDVMKAQQTLSGAQNPDREYVQGILSDTRQVTDLYKEEASSGKNPVLSQYAREMLPRLSQHYRNALRLSATINAPIATIKREHIPSHKS